VIWTRNLRVVFASDFRSATGAVPVCFRLQYLWFPEAVRLTDEQWKQDEEREKQPEVPGLSHGMGSAFTEWGWGAILSQLPSYHPPIVVASN
jgi:hypothetical protein